MATIFQTGFSSGLFPDSVLTPLGWARSSGWTSIVEGSNNSRLAALNNAVFTFAALGAIYGAFEVYSTTVTNADILTFNNVNLRIVSSTQIAIRVAGVNVATLTIPTATINTWYGVRFKVVLGLVTSDISFEWNGGTALTATNPTLSATVTTLNIGPGSGRVSSVIINDNSTAVNNGIPTAIPTFELLKASAVGTINNGVAGGLATVPAWYGGSASAWASLNSTQQWAYLDQIRARIYKLDNGGGLVASYPMTTAATEFAGLSTIVEDDLIAYFPRSGQSIVDMASGAEFTGSGHSFISANYVRAGSFYYRLTSFTILQKFSLSFGFISNIFITGAGGGSQVGFIYYSSAKGYIFCSPRFTNLSAVFASTGAVTNITIAGGGDTQAWIERAAANFVYCINGTNVHKLGTSGTPVLSATIALGFTVASNSGRYGKNQGEVAAYDSGTDNFFILDSGGTIYRYTTSTDTVAFFGIAPSGSNGEWSLYATGGKIYANSKSGIRIYSASSGSLLSAIVFPVATASYARMWDDGTYIAVTVGNEVAFVDKTLNIMVQATDKAVCSRGVTNGASTVISYISFDAATSARQDLLLSNLQGSPTNISGINIFIGRAYKLAIGTGTLQVGIKCADGTNVNAGTTASLSTSPADFQRQLQFKSGTTAFVPGDLGAGAAVYITAQP